MATVTHKKYLSAPVDIFGALRPETMADHGPGPLVINVDYTAGTFTIEGVAGVFSLPSFMSIARDIRNDVFGSDNPRLYAACFPIRLE